MEMMNGLLLFGPFCKKKKKDSIEMFSAQTEVHQKEKLREFQSFFDFRAIFVNDHLNFYEISQSCGLMQKL